MFENLVEILKANPRKIVYTEGPDARILESAARLKKEGFLTPILVGNVDEVKAAAEKGGFDIEGLEIIDPASYEGMDEMVDLMVELRKGKMTAEECRQSLLKGNYFGTMLVKMGKADALLGGATYSTADTVRPALQLVKTKKGANLVSSCFILVKEGAEMLCMGDCAINISYEDKLDKEGNVKLTAAAQLAEVAVATANTAKVFGMDPKVAMLSYSTKGSGKGANVDMVRDATAIAKEMAPELDIDGEMQFDAAVSPTVGQLKFPGSKVAGYANTFIFPEIQSGNIGYKIAQRLGGYAAFGPILQGLNAPINDLSRGCNAEEVYQMSIITAALA
ncbi:MAG: phosphate acetyltransferase [Oscillospiraceae bacterium]|jgi:phosphate acetyltransferase|nr:phosphate acetyltransferase [Oscillospiraceae bacterium]MBQ1642557.1 phosphate acetyltransferase [Oscillospiraceae bacterium]MBQ5489133.1 phosphate acetyltransferase [Oscillospiraceae bacterium]